MATVQVKSKPVEIKYNNYALRRAEEMLGMPLSQFAAGAAANAVGVREITVLLCAGLLHKDKDADLEDADAIIDEVGYDAVSEAINAAMAEYFPLVDGSSKNG